MCFVRLYLKIDILYTRRKHLHDNIISLKVAALAHCLTPPLCIEITVQNHESERPYIFKMCFNSMNFVFVSKIVGWILELFRL